jgi:O-antigen/teichoic acid export membrane protein
MFAVESSEQSAARVGVAARVTTLVTAAVGVLLTAASPWMVPLVFGAGFSPAVPVIGVLVLCYVLSVSGSVAGAALSARGRPGLRSFGMAVSAVLYVAAMVALVPPWGAFGAALAMFFGTVIPSYLNIYLLHTRCGVPLSEFFRYRASDLDVLRHAPKRLLPASRASQPSTRSDPALSARHAG